MKKITISLGIIGVVAAIIIGATTAYFSDTETSTGNTFTAGAIDLTIDNESYYSYANPGIPSPEKYENNWYNEGTSWLQKDLDGNELFFDFHDLKPGDWGEDTISIHVDNNDAWACLAIDMTENSDRTCTEPELEFEDGNCVEYVDGESDTHFNGELAGELQIAVWADDGDNVFEQGERLLQLGGPNDPIVTIQNLAGLSDGGPAGVLTLADSFYSVFADDNAAKPLVGGEKYYLAKAWCFGDLISKPVDKDDHGYIGYGESGYNGPDARGTGFICNGGSVTNASQTDQVKGDITFYAEQARNNNSFLCSELGSK